MKPLSRFLRPAILLVLGVVLVAAASPSFAGSKNQVRTFFMNTGLQPTATGNVTVVANTSLNAFKIAVKKMTPGQYNVLLDGAVVDTLTVGSKGKGSVGHKFVAATKRAAAQPLPYDPRGGQISVAATTDVVLEADVPETPEQNQQRVEIETHLNNLGVTTGDAKADFEAVSGRMQFEVEIEGAAPNGTYDLLVDGTKVGTITTGVDGDGRVDFDSMPSAGGDDDEQGDGGASIDQLLTFDPRGKNVVIQQNGVDLFSVLFPAQATPEGGETGGEGGGEGGGSQGGEGGGGD